MGHSETSNGKDRSSEEQVTKVMLKTELLIVEIEVTSSKSKMLKQINCQFRI